MSNTPKVYPAKPTRTLGKAPHYGSDGFPAVSEEELKIAREVFWDIFMVKHDGDCYNMFATALGCDRNRAKQVYYFILYQKGLLQKQQAVERKVRAQLAFRIRSYTEFLENPETIYQIMCRAEDQVREKEEKNNQRKNLKC